MLPRYSIRMWFTFTMIFYKCWTSVTDTGILSLNLKIDNSCLKTVNRNLKSTATIKNYNFSYFQRRISASIWNFIVLLHTAPRKGLLCTYRASIRYSAINFPLRQFSVWIYFLPSLLCKPSALFSCYKGINPGHRRRQEHAVSKISQYLQCFFPSKSLFL